MMSGLFTPVSSMPEWAQAITVFNPLKYFIEAMRMVYLKGSGLVDLNRCKQSAHQHQNQHEKEHHKHRLLHRR